MAIELKKPIDPIQRAALVDLVRILDARRVRYIIIGALARDILLSHAHGLEIGRATRDLDAAVLVDSWDDFQSLKGAMTASGLFAEPTLRERAHQRLIYIGASTKEKIPIDLIPFGGVEQGDGMLAWPPAGDFVMNAAGHEAVLANRVEVALGDGVSLSVASIPGVVLLKLLAWNERPTERAKDAEDIRLFLASYCDTEQDERLYEGTQAIMEKYDYDLARSGAFLLGMDVGNLASRITARHLGDLVADQRRLEQLETQMFGAPYTGDAPAQRRTYLNEFLDGLQETLW